MVNMQIKGGKGIFVEKALPPATKAAAFSTNTLAVKILHLPYMNLKIRKGTDGKEG